MQGGNGLETADAAACAAECESRSVCQFWTHVAEWKVNCYLKSSFDEQGEKAGATSGSIGVKSSAGSVDIAEIKYDAIAELSRTSATAAAAGAGSSATRTSTTAR